MPSQYPHLSSSVPLTITLTISFYPSMHVIQLYCIVTGSCRPFRRSVQLSYFYEWEGSRELFVAVVFQQLSWCSTIYRFITKFTIMSNMLQFSCISTTVMISVYVMHVTTSTVSCFAKSTQVSAIFFFCFGEIIIISLRYVFIIDWQLLATVIHILTLA